MVKPPSPSPLPFPATNVPCVVWTDHPPFSKETLDTYLAVSKEAVSSVLLTDQKGKQSPIHYVSRTLNEAERNYAPMKKLALEASGKLAKFVIELGVYNITFEPRNSVKAQVLADFITETPNGESPKGYFRTPEVAPKRDDTEEWTLFTDGASSVKGSGAGLVLIGLSGAEHTYALRLTFDSTNNEAEYEALLAGLRIARGMNIQNLEIKVHSKLVVVR
ncbi:reverse transcriptase domain-containing protein [Tanacetum coccineum]